MWDGMARCRNVGRGGVCILKEHSPVGVSCIVVGVVAVNPLGSKGVCRANCSIVCAECQQEHPQQQGCGDGAPDAHNIAVLMITIVQY